MAFQDTYTLICDLRSFKNLRHAAVMTLWQILQTLKIKLKTWQDKKLQWKQN